MSDILVSIVIPTLNSANTLDSCLSSIQANMTSFNYEIVLVDGGSTDDTIEIAKKYPVKLLFSEKPQSRQRNKGIKHAAGEIVAFTDSDCSTANNWLATLATHFDDPSVAGVGGSNLAPDDDPFFAQCVAVLLESFLGSGDTRNTKIYETTKEVNHNPPSNSAVRKHILLEIDGFGSELRYGEDIILDAKIKRKGYKLIYDPKLVVWHPRAKTLKGFLKQMFRWSRARAYCSIKYPETMPIGYYSVTAFIIFILLSIPVSILVPFLKPVFIIGWLCYFSFIVLSSLYISIKKRRAVFIIILPFLAFLEHCILGIGFITGLIFQEKLEPTSVS